VETWKKPPARTRFVVDEGDVADRRADAGAEDAELGVALLFEQWRQRRASWTDWRLAWRVRPMLGPQIWSGAFVTLGHAAVVVVGHAHFQDGDAETLNPAAKATLAVPFGVPVGEEKDGRACTGALATPSELKWSRGRERVGRGRYCFPARGIRWNW